MTHAELLKRISIDPRICFGKPCIRGHRIWASLILDLLAAGATIDAILQDYPQLTRDTCSPASPTARRWSESATSKSP